MSEEHKRQIFDYIFNTQDVPENVMSEFSRWLVEHEGDDETEYLMLKKWQEYSDTIFGEKNLEGLDKVRQSIRSEIHSTKRKAVLSALLVLVCFFMGGLMSHFLMDGRTHMVTLVTAKDNIGRFTLPDGTKVSLGSESSLTYEKDFAGKERAVSLNGEGFFEVIKDSGRPFTIAMNNLDVEVLGTSFGAVNRIEKGYEEIILKSGSVKVSGMSLEEDITLVPDQMLSFSSFNGKASIKEINAEDACRWHEEYLAFDNARFEDILSNIGRRFNVTVKPLTSVSMDERMSMTITSENLGATMDLLTSLLPIRYEIVNNTLIIRDNAPTN